MITTDIRQIFFNEAAHKYTDDLGNPYTSTTTVIGKYHSKFDTKGGAIKCSQAGKNGNPKYRTKDGSRHLTPAEIEFQWTKLQTIGCDRGNERHNFLEYSIKESNNYKRTGSQKFINDKIYTIPTIMEHHDFGELKLDFFVKTGVKERHPVIYKVLEYYTNKGYRIYAEIGVYWYDFLISGLIDVLLVKDDTFIILDWKTNKDLITYEPGYFDKDFEGNRTGKFIAQPNKKFKYPLGHIPESTGYKYALQVSMYAYLTELFGLKCTSLMIAQITHSLYTKEDILIDPVVANFYPNPSDRDFLIGLEKVVFYPVNYMKDDIVALCNHHTMINAPNRNKQRRFFQ